LQVVCPNFFDKKTNYASFDLPIFQLLWWLKNQGLSFFLPKRLVFQPILTQNIYKNNLKIVINLSISFKKPQKIILKTKINLKQKINPNSDIFFTNFRVKKTPNMNSSLPMEQFDTKYHSIW